MPTSVVTAESVLAIDVGAIHTRVILFDVVEGNYRYLASGTSNTTANAPYSDISEGIRQALDRLSSITGRTFIGEDERLIVPSRSDGSGIDTVVATISAGPPLRIIAVGLLDDVSVESAVNLANTTYAMVVERIGLNDRRRIDERINTVMRLNPDLLILTGGTDGGASHSVMKMVEAVGLACFLLPEDNRPEILYAGNQALRAQIKSALGMVGNVHFAANIRPSLDLEDIDIAQGTLVEVFRRLRARQIPGVYELDSWSKGNLLPTSMAVGRLVRALSKIYGSSKGVLAVDLGASATSLIAAYAGNLISAVYSKYGLGPCLGSFLDHASLDDVTRWLRLDIPHGYVRNYINHKAVYPNSVPATIEDLDIEQALARAMLRLAMQKFSANLRSRGAENYLGMLPSFEPLMVSGSVFTQAPSYSQALLMLLDGLQPLGVTTVVLDKNHLMPAFGAVAGINPLLVVQSIDFGAFVNLGVVISPIGNTRYGTSILRIRVQYENGSESKYEIKHGALELIPLNQGEAAQVFLQPLHGCDIGMGGAGRGGRIRVVGGAMGIIIDARGRPLQLSNDPARRREVFHRWLKALHN